MEQYIERLGIVVNNGGWSDDKNRIFRICEKK